jgi:hypothetical protein
MDPNWISSEIAKEKMRLKNSRVSVQERVKNLKIPGFDSHLNPQEQRLISSRS